MNAKQVFVATVAIAAFSFAGVVSAQAQQDGGSMVSSYTYVEPAHTQKSREQVRAELVQALKDGSFNLTSYNYVERAHSQKSREQVRAELAAARARGELRNPLYLP